MRYGSRVLELAKGKSAIDIADQAALIAALEVLAQAVSAGELMVPSKLRWGRRDAALSLSGFQA